MTTTLFGQSEEQELLVGAVRTLAREHIAPTSSSCSSDCPNTIVVIPRSAPPVRWSEFRTRPR